MDTANPFTARDVILPELSGVTCIWIFSCFVSPAFSFLIVSDVFPLFTEKFPGKL